MKQTLHVFIACFVLCIPVFGQQSIDALATKYSQAFDGLATSGSGDLSSCPGWFIQTGSTVDNSLEADNGNSTDPIWFSYGTGSSAERALGSIASDDDMYAGWFFVNNTESTIRKIILKYRGEQWRNTSHEEGGIININSPGAQRDSIEFSYQINPGTIDLSAGGYTVVDALEFESRVNQRVGEGAAATNGNSAQYHDDNIYILLDVADQGVAPGDSIILRWHHPLTVNFELTFPIIGGVNISASKGLAIDDVEVYFFDEHWYTDNSGVNSHTLTTWTPMPDGSRPPYADAVTVSPSSFTANHQHFTFQKDFESGYTGAFPVTGTNSKILVEPGIEVTLNGDGAQILGDVDVRLGATLNLENTDFQADFINISNNSTVKFSRTNGGTTTVPEASYYNLELETSGGGGRFLSLEDDIEVRGDLTFSGTVDGVTFGPLASISFTGNSCGISSLLHNGEGVFPKIVIDNGTTLTLGSFPLDGNNINTLVHSEELENNGDLVIPSSTNLEIHGNLTNSGAVTINNNGSLVQTSASALFNTGDFNVIRQGSPSGDVYNFWSSPITAGTISSNGGGGMLTGSPVYQYRKGGKYRSQYQAIGAKRTMQNGRGYAVEDGGTSTFTGTVNNGTLAHGVELLEDTSFNLLGNPYPSGILARDFVVANTSLIEGTISIWDQCNSGPSTFNGDAEFITVNALGSASDCPTFSDQIQTLETTHIPACQAFFVTAHTAGNVVFNNDMRTSVSNNFKSEKGKPIRSKGGEAYPSKAVLDDASRVWVSVEDLETGDQSNTLIGFIEDATEQSDYWYDAGMVIEESDQSLLYSFNPEKRPHSIQGLPSLRTSQEVVELGFIAPKSGSYSMDVSSMNLREKGYYGILVDNATYRYHLVDNGAYTFSAAKGADNSRFEIMFLREITTELRELIEGNETLPIGYISNHSLKLFQDFTFLQMTDVAGNLVFSGNNLNDEVELPTALAAGVYVLSGNGERGAVSQKIVVR